jgi:hypothetical protein
LITLAAVLAVAGWDLHFRSPAAYLWCALLFALTAAPAWRLARSGFPWAGAADALLRAAVFGFAAIVLTGFVTGAVGAIGISGYLAVLTAIGVSVFITTRSRPSVVASLPRVPTAVAAVALPLLAFIVAVGLVQSAPTLYDSVSYHLWFSASWLQGHRLSIVPTPFSDPAQAYQPANGELFFLWLMLPFHGDLLARAGQLPFLVLAVIALYALARRSGAPSERAVYAPFFFLLARPVIEQAAGADVDLVCTAMFLCSLYLGVIANDRDTARDWAVWGVAVGLFLGTKYLALVYAVVVLVIPVLRGVRLRSLSAIPGILGFGAPWYLRNWIIAGSPIFPSSLILFGVTIAPGAFTRAAMNNSVFHVTEIRLLPAILAHAFGAPTMIVWVPCALAGVIALVWRRRWWPAAYLAAVPLVIVVLFWRVIPDNGDSRFLLPAVAVAMIPLTFTFGTDRRWNAGVHAVYLLAAVWILVGSPREIPASLPWFMGHWLTLEGLIRPEALTLFGAGVMAAALVRLIAGKTRQAPAIIGAAWALGTVALLRGAAVPRSLEDVRLLALSPTYIRVELLAAWDWLHHHVDGATIANSGNNLPYPLFGDQLSNHVAYINLDRHADWRFHDYAKNRRHALDAPAGALAVPSGQLMPVAGAVADAARPRYERWEGTAGAWRENLRSANVTYLVLTALSAYERDYQRHNSGGFPIEDDWAQADPGAFTLLYENAAARIYRVNLSAVAAVH